MKSEYKMVNKDKRNKKSLRGINKEKVKNETKNLDGEDRKKKEQRRRK